ATGRSPPPYGLFAKLDEQAGDEAVPRLLYVLSDRTLASWDAGRLDDLIAQRDRLEPKPNGVYLDVGAEGPGNVSITAAEVKPQSLPANQEAVVRVTVQAVGQPCDTELTCRVDGDPAPERRPVKLEAGQSGAFEFRRRLKPGMHQAELSLAASDRMPFDNMRFVTFEVRAPRRVLVLTDDADDAYGLELVLRATGNFDGEGGHTPDLTELTPADLANYRAVVVFNVAKPNDLAEFWEKLESYWKAGGHLLIAPGSDARRDDYNVPKARALMPGQLDEWVEKEKDRGVPWKEGNLQH